MRSVLALDPAWTATEPSGVALLAEDDAGWKSLAIAPSYEQFIDLADGKPVDWTQQPPAGEPPGSELLAAAWELLDGEQVDVVTVDMPMATVPITGRRAADDSISGSFGAKGCGTHSPNAERPGSIGASLTHQLGRLGYPLATGTWQPGTTPVTIEVYPHPAMLVLAHARYRVPYKVSRIARYWPERSPADRRRQVMLVWRALARVLRRSISDVGLPLPTAREARDMAPSALKRYEDALDALICAWVGIQYLEGRCAPYGDDTCAIWTP